MAITDVGVGEDMCTVVEDASSTSVVIIADAGVGEDMCIVVDDVATIEHGDLHIAHRGGAGFCVTMLSLVQFLSDEELNMMSPEGEGWRQVLLASI